MPRTLLVTACDAGNANFLLPVLDALTVPYRLFAQAPASDIFSRNGVPHDRVERCGWEGLKAQGDSVLSSGPFGSVLAGTSWGPTLDKAVTLAGQEHGLPTAAVIEHWDIYRERFSRVEGGHIVEPDAFLPSEIWVPDARAVSEAASAGLPAERLHAVGQPHLQAQARRLRRDAPPPRGCDVVFVSERVAGDFHRGFTEHDSLAVLVEAMDFSRHRLVIKLHPQEQAGKYSYLAEKGVEASILKVCDIPELILGAHRIVGMFSMLLLEAALARADVMSLMPGGDPALFVGNRIGATTPVADARELRPLLADGARFAAGSADFASRFGSSREQVAAAVRRFAA